MLFLGRDPQKMYLNIITDGVCSLLSCIKNYCPNWFFFDFAWACGTKNKTKTVKVFVLLLHFISTFTLPSTYLCRTYFVEFTTRMNKNTSLLHLFAVLAFLRCSSRCLFSRLFIIIAFFIAVLFVVILISFLFCRCGRLFFFIAFLVFCPRAASHCCFHSFFLLLSLLYSRRYPCYLFPSLLFRCIAVVVANIFVAFHSHRYSFYS